MSIFHKIKRRLLRGSQPERISVSAAGGYDLWSQTYDDESWNLMVALDEEIFRKLLQRVSLKDKVIADVGCGTGRHWSLFNEQQARSVIGFDVSQGMLDKLLQKHPAAEVRLMKDTALKGMEDQSADVVVSTLAFAHFKYIDRVIQEWSRVLKSGGNLIITDAHPVSFSHGADITFGSQSKTYQIAHYIYPLDMVREIATDNGLEEVNFMEQSIDASMKHFYEARKALDTYHKFEGVPLIYGIHFRKK